LIVTVIGDYSSVVGESYHFEGALRRQGKDIIDQKYVVQFWL
jgi:hypothetical protein